MLLALCWGPSFLFIKLALIDLSPTLLSFFRIGIGALILNLILFLRSNYLPRELAFWHNSAIAALFSVAIPFMLINWGQQFIESSLGSLLNGTTPFFTVIFSAVLLNEEKVSKNKITGIFIGFIGLLVLVYPNISNGISASMQGILAVVLASASYGIGWVWVKKKLTGVTSFKAPAAQLLIATIYLLPFAIFDSINLSDFKPSIVSIGSIIALGTLGTAIAFILYFKLIERAGASYASMVTYLVPAIGMILGSIVLYEKLTVWMLAGSFMILYGIFFANKTQVRQNDCKRVDLRVLSKFR